MKYLSSHSAPWCLTSTWVSGVQTAVSGRRGCWLPGCAQAWRALGPPHPALGMSGAAPLRGWLCETKRIIVRLSQTPIRLPQRTLSVTDLEVEGERWYLVLCQGGREASHLGLATGMEGCCFLGSLAVSGCLEPGSEGSFPPVWVAVLKKIDK